MISFFSKFKIVILVIIIICLLGGLGYVGVGAANEAYGAHAPVAKVGKENIKYVDYDRDLKQAYRNFRSQETEEQDEAAREQLKQIVLQNLITKSVFKQAANELGLGVSDMEIAYNIKNDPDFSMNGSFDKITYLQTIRGYLGMNPEEYEQNIKNRKLASEFQKVLFLVAKTSPQEEEFAKKTILKDETAGKEQFMLVKTETLANNFSHSFNQSHPITFTKLAPNYSDQQED